MSSNSKTPAKPAFTIEGTLGRFQKHVGQLLKSHASRGVALALSGGVDSIALAWLWHTSGRKDGAPRVFKLPFHAIIVDHGLRPESHAEAHLTADRFEYITGGRAHVVRLDKHLLQDKSRLETEARNLRYKALARVCRSEGLNVMLTAHHADDQVETMLHRLVMQHVAGTGNGLAGIPGSSSPVGADFVDVHGARADPGCSLWAGSSNFDKPGAHLYKPLDTPTIALLRPLLPFRKGEFKALCRSTGLEWAEDSTNQDPTLTRRNAIRHILESGKLPRAFQPEKLLAITEAAKAADKLEYERLRVVHQSLQPGKTFDCKLGLLETPLPDFKTMPRSLAQTYARDIVGAVGHMSPNRQDTTGLLADINRWQELEATPSHRSGSASWLPRAEMPRQLRGVRSAPIRSTAKKLPLPWSFCRVADFDRVAHGPLPPDLYLQSREDGHSKYFCNTDYPEPTMWDNRFWVKVRVNLNPGQKITDGIVVRHLRSNCGRGFKESKNRKLRQLGAWIRAIIKKYGALPMVPALQLVPKHSIGAKPTQPVQKKYANDILAVPSEGYVKDTFKSQIQMEVAFKGLGDAGMGASITGA